MPLRLPLKALTFCLLLLSTTAAAQAPQAKQEAKARKELERKALALLDETLKEAEALKVVENHAAVRTQAADILWPRDEKRARALFRAAASDLAAVKSTDPNRRRKAFENSSLLRRSFISIVGARDAQLALKLLHDSRPATEAGSNAPAGDPDSELMREQWLKRSAGGPDWEPKTEQWLKKLAAESDPKTALRLAEEELSKGFTFEGLGQLQRLCRKDPKAATRLAGKIVERLRGEAPDGGQQTWGPALYLLRGILLRKPGEGPRYYNLPSTPSPEWMWPKSLVLVMEEADVRELADLVVAAALKDSYAKGVYGMMVSVRPLIPELEKLVPASAARLNLRLAELDKLLDPRARSLAQYDVDIRRPPEAILEKAAQAPAETRKHLYQAAAAKLFVAGEVERARAVVNENLSGEERTQMLAHLDDAEVARAVEQGKPDEARAVLPRIINSNERRASALAKVAAAYAAKGDKERAAVLLEQARGLVGLQLAANARDFIALMNIARDYAQVEPVKTFELIESLLDLVQAHGRVSAALRPERPPSEKRAAWDRLFNPQGEVSIPMDGRMWGGTYMPFLKVLPELARVDFDRTRQLADRFDPNELRLVARLIIVRSILSDRLDLVAGSPGGDIYYGQ